MCTYVCHACLPTVEDVNSQRFQQTEAFPSVFPGETVQHNVHPVWRNPEAAERIEERNISTSERECQSGHLIIPEDCS